MNSKIVFIYMVFLMMGVVVFNGTAAQAAMIQVTTTQDKVPGSLRAAITTANTNNQDNTIYLPAGTYFLKGAAGDDANAGGDLDIHTDFNLTIIGSGKTKTDIDGNDIDRVLHILYGTVTITDLTIRKGKAPDGLGLGGGIALSGGGIFNLGNLTLTRCIIKQNRSGDGGEGNMDDSDNGGSGGGIYNRGELILDNCIVTGNSAGKGGDNHYEERAGNGGNGGGILNSGILTLNNCDITYNIAGNGGDTTYPAIGSDGGEGGGIYNTNILNIYACTISGNITGDIGKCEDSPKGYAGNGGGILNSGNLTMSGCAINYNSTGFDIYGCDIGGGICNWYYLTLTNCTISENISRNAGGLYNGGNSQLIGVTVVDNTAEANGGGICNEGFISLKNTIVANNTDGDYGYGPDCYGTLNWVSYSLIEDTGGYNITGFQQSNILGKDPVLGPLQDNGGPTYTYALLPGSPAIDAGNSTDLSEDQRGFARPVDIPGIANVSDGADIGAYEFDANCSISGAVTLGGTGMAEITLTFSNNGGTTTTDADGNYSHNVLYNWSGSVTPTKEGYTFNPSSRNYTTLTANQSNQDYTATSLVPPQISLLPTQLYFGADTSGKQTGPQSFLISNSGGGFLNWTATADTPDAGWLSCNPASGTGPALVNVSINPTGRLPGTYTGTITVADPYASNSAQTVKVTLTVYDAGSTHLPFGSFDTPIDGAGVTGSIAVTGWALDNIGIEYVKIYRDPAAGEGSGSIYIGAAIMVEGARPDIEAAYPGYPDNHKAGWGYMLLTYGLPNQGNGTFTLYAKATDKEGNTVTLGTRTIYGDNAHAVKPFGAIDAPVQGGTASGSDYINYGWALTPLPNTIPTTGSTITVWVDGVPLGNPVYNENRPDVAALFPGYNNSTGAGGHFFLDTTVYDNGLHTISWSVTDNAGNSDGIGSRYFTIQNLGGGMGREKCNETSTRRAIKSFDQTFSKVWPPAGPPEAIFLQRGYCSESDFETLSPDENGRYTVESKELERLVIYLEDPEIQSDRGEYKETVSEPSKRIESDISGEYKIRPYKGFRDEGRGEPCVHPVFSNSHSTLNTQHLTLKNTPLTYYQGYLINGDQLKPLPIGSTLDVERGVFYWQPGPGFLGDYELVFVEKTGIGERMEKHIVIRIVPHSG